MSNVDEAIKILLRKHKDCDSKCPELWLVKELQKARAVVKSVLHNKCVMSTTDISTIAKDLNLEL